MIDYGFGRLSLFYSCAIWMSFYEIFVMRALRWIWENTSERNHKWNPVDR